MQTAVKRGEETLQEMQPIAVKRQRAARGGHRVEEDAVSRGDENYDGMYGTDGRPVKEILAELDELAGDEEDYDDIEEDAEDIADADRIMAEIEAGRMKVYPAERVYRELGLL